MRVWYAGKQERKSPELPGSPPLTSLPSPAQGWLTPRVHPSREVTILLLGHVSSPVLVLACPPGTHQGKALHQPTQRTGGVKAHHAAANSTKAPGRPRRPL